jgi:hypothetical protein
VHRFRNAGASLNTHTTARRGVPSHKSSLDWVQKRHGSNMLLDLTRFHDG